MGSLHLRLFVALCLCASVIDLVQVHCSRQSFVQPTIHGPFTRKHFLKRRIPYNPHSTATFQLELLQAGDIHPHPGPNKENGEILPSPDRYCADHQVQQGNKYTPTELLKWRHLKTQLPQDICDIIQSYGIHRRRTRRGTRAGRKKNNIRGPRLSPTNETHVKGKKDSRTGDMIQTNQNQLKLCSMNVRSVRNKSSSIYDFICDGKVDMCAMTETWLSDKDSAVIHEITPPGYHFIHQPRVNRRGGGTGLLFKETIDARQVVAGEKMSFEFAEYHILFKNFELKLINVYRPPYSDSHRVSINVFLNEFSEFLQAYLLSSIPLLVTGDFNIHVDSEDNPESRSFNDLLESLCCTQHVQFCTHIHGHTLDLIISRQSDNVIIGQPWSDDTLLSDHFPVNCLLNSSKPPLPVKQISFRRICSIDLQLLRKDISESILCSESSVSSLNELVLSYDVTLRSILDKHAPMQTKKVSSRVQVPWFTDQVRKEKKKRRKAEKRWLKSKSEQDYQTYKMARNVTLFVMNRARRKYYSEMIDENSHDQKRLFNVTKSLLNMSKQDPMIPPSVDKCEFANNLGNFFQDKILKIHCDIQSSLDSSTDTISGLETARSSSHVSVPNLFTEFLPLTQMDVEKLIMQMSKKSCALDPMPTHLLLKCTDILLPIFTKLINLSLGNGQFPSSWKVALVRPLLKKPGLELSPNNLRPVNNLQYISKLVEGAATQQIQQHLSQNLLLPSLQSAYRQFHSTETALLKIKNDLLMAMDRQKVTLLILLDLSSAFDTIVHDVLVDTLHTGFGITGTVLDWIKSYLTDRQQKIRIDDVDSNSFKVSHGVPQGSRLGPLLFTLYTSKLIKDIQEKFPIVSCHCYADDTQLYISFNPNDDIHETISVFEACIKYVRLWMLQNKLKLNESKTEFMIIGTSRQISKLDVTSIRVGNSVVTPSNTVRNLGVWFDTTLSMETQVSKVCKAAFFMLYNLRHIRKYLDQKSAETLVHAYIISKLDYGNGLLLGLPESQIMKLQRIQNACARLVCNSSKFCHISPLLRLLHWLPVRQRIVFKILLIVFKALNGQAPNYILELLTLKFNSHSHNLRSSNDTLLLQLPTHRTKVTMGDRAFSCAAPKIWNKLPFDIRNSQSVSSFKTRLKTHLFAEAFE